MSFLRTYTTAELRHISMYLEEFQGYTYIEPSIKHKKYWISTLIEMLSQKAINEPLENYISRVENIIRWFKKHKVVFKRGFSHGSAFYNKITSFTRNVTDTTFHFKNSNQESIEILKTDITFSESIISLFDRVPNNQNFRYEVRPRPQRSILDDLFEDLFTFDMVTLNHRPSTSDKPPPPEHQDEEVTDDTKGLECKVCLTNKICIVLSKCGHAFCYTCTTRIENKCATCRTPFTASNKVRMYI